MATYDPTGNLLVICGRIAHGFADGTFLSLARRSPRFSTKVGADGEVSRTKSADQTGTVTLTLMQSSTFNEDMSLLLASGEIGPFLYQEGRTVIAAGECWIQNAGDVQRAKEEGEQEWEVALGNMTTFNVAGND